MLKGWESTASRCMGTAYLRKTLIEQHLSTDWYVYSTVHVHVMQNASTLYVCCTAICHALCVNHLPLGIGF